MDSTEVSFPCSIVITAYGYQLKLMSVVDSGGFLFTADVRKENIQVDFINLPDSEKKQIESQLKEIKNPNQNTEKASNTEISSIKKALSRINVENIGLFWDRKASRTLLFLEIKMDLSNTVTLFDGNFELDYLSLDFIIATGDKEITESDRARKNKIIAARNSVWEVSIKENELQKLIKNIRKTENLAAHFKEQIQNNETNGSQKYIHEASEQIISAQNSLKNTAKNIANNQNNTNYNQHLVQMLENTNEQARKITAIIATKFKENKYDFVNNERKLNQLTANIADRQQVDNHEFKNEKFSAHQIVSIENEIEKLTNANLKNFNDLKELSTTDF
jgi:hypothetical protein